MRGRGGIAMVTRLGRAATVLMRSVAGGRELQEDTCRLQVILSV